MTATNDTPTNGPPLTYPEGLPDSVAPLGDSVPSLLRILVAVVGASGVVLGLGIAYDLRQFYHSYLFGYVFALDIALGALFWVLTSAARSFHLRCCSSRSSLASTPTSCTRGTRSSTRIPQNCTVTRFTFSM
jgi:hypothetical protein